MADSCRFACFVHYFVILSFYECLFMVATYQFW